MEICCPIPSEYTESDIKSILPSWKTKIVDILVRNLKLEIKFLIAAKTVEDIRKWLEAFEEHTKCTYSVRSTGNNCGRYVQFKQRLNCQHNTRCSRIYHPNKKTGTKNTNCPSSLNITLRAIKNKYRGKDKSKAPHSEMPCEIVLLATHNHPTSSADVLRFRNVSKETKEKLMQLFDYGHAPATALETLKIDIRLNYDNFENLLIDKKYCPNYKYCHHLYTSAFKEKRGLITSHEFLINRIDKYNKETNCESAKVTFDDTDYALCICPPLLKRIHKYIKGASEVVFIDSSSTIDHGKGNIFVLLTHSDCGSLPLAIFILSSEKHHLIEAAFSHLKYMLGDDIFGGKIEGPDVFLTDDNSAKLNAIKSNWERSQCLLCTFNVLQSAWRWLLKSENAIKEQDRVVLFSNFRSIMYATSIEECEQKYKETRDVGRKYPNYVKYLDEYWNRREVWALAYRENFLAGENNTNNYYELAIRILKEKIFDRIKQFNLVQATDFILTRFIQYYQKRLLDAVQNKSTNIFFGLEVPTPPEEIIEKVQQLSDNIYLVPSETTPELHYIVNTDILLCTCNDGKEGKVCKHINWICPLVTLGQFYKNVDNSSNRELFYLIATGDVPTDDYIMLLDEEDNENVVASQHIIKSEIVVDTSGLLCLVDQHVKERPNNDLLLQDCNNIIEEIKNRFCEFAKQSPFEVKQSLEKMKENLGKLKTVSSFNNSCAKFGLESQRRRKRPKTILQPTSLSRRKSTILKKRILAHVHEKI